MNLKGIMLCLRSQCLKVGWFMISFRHLRKDKTSDENGLGQGAIWEFYGAVGPFCILIVGTVMSIYNILKFTGLKLTKIEDWLIARGWTEAKMGNSVWEDEKSSGDGWWWWLQKNVNVLNATVYIKKKVKTVNFFMYLLPQ